MLLLREVHGADEQDCNRNSFRGRSKRLANLQGQRSLRAIVSGIQSEQLGYGNTKLGVGGCCAAVCEECSLKRLRGLVATLI